MEYKGWYGVDLDKTLVKYDKFQGAGHIGEPIPLMVNRVKKMLADGKRVKIFTARVSHNNADRYETLEAIKKWTKETFGQELEATAEKDYQLIEYYDDRAKQVIPNTGILLEDVMKKTQSGGK